MEDVTTGVYSIIGKKLRCADNSYIEVEQLLGTGASGAAYKCSRTIPPANGVGASVVQKLAAKVIDIRQLHLLPDFERERDKLKREVSILASICHSGVVNLHGVLDTSDMLVLLMDLVEGGELFNRVAKGPFTEEQARYVFTQVAHTLKFLHSRGVIHRDLKLENILVSAQPATGFFEVRVADFGLSKAVAGNFTKARSYVGTPQYWAPEVIMAGKSNSTYTFTADLWSLGCVLYVMVGGCYPFNCEDDWETDVLAGRFSFSSQAFENVSPECKDLIRGLLRTDPDTRFGFKEIFDSPWMKREWSAGVPPLPVLMPLSRPPIAMNLGPLFVGASVEPLEVDTIPTNTSGAAAAESSTREKSPTATREGQKRRKEEYRANVLKLFNASEILELLVSVFYRFHQAYLVFRGRNELTTEIQSLLFDIKELTMATRKVFKRFQVTCDSVRELLEDVAVVIEDGSPELAVDMFQNLQQWVKEVLQDGAEMRAGYTAALKKASALVSCTRELNSPWMEAQQQDLRSGAEIESTVNTVYMLENSLSRQKAGHPTVVELHTGSTAYRDARNSLFHQVEVVDGASDRSEVAKDLLDFLFVSPEVVHMPCSADTGLPSPIVSSPQMEPSEDPCMASRKNSHQVPSPTLDIVPSNQMEDGSLQIARVNNNPKPLDPGPYLRKATLLIKGLEELQRISDILEQCAAFWDNLDVTLEMVKKFKDQTTVLLKASVRNDRQVQRLLDRIENYNGFWEELQKQCVTFVEGSQKSGENMRKFVSIFNETMIRGNALASYNQAQNQSNKEMVAITNEQRE